MDMKNWVHFDNFYVPAYPSLKEDPGKYFEARRDMKTREDDVLLITYPKCGTHWVWEIIVMLLKGKAEYHTLDKDHLHLDSVDLSSLENLPSPRVISTHLPFRWLPQEHFRTGHNMFGGYFGFLKDFYRAVQSNKAYSLHTVYYEKLKKDPVPEILKLADYLGVSCLREEAADIADKCSFQNLKHASDNIKDHGEIKRIMDEWGLELPKIHRKGEVGDWKNWYTVSQSERHDAIIEEELKDIDFDLQLIYENTQ